ncbi:MULTISPECIES: ATP synthase subunit e [Vibrio]|uniref:Uncharacterized protein n=2 Tax=Vibrio TaxID=662 RepID=A0A7X4RWN9_9VIBR|nr:MULTISPECIES: hypothetical protein [Vibrio]MBF9000645.1 hypothetical protein [Vibrio nitrifigilis]MZI95873.1 hypothetical protein [Vibrio eleionomae]
MKTPDQLRWAQAKQQGIYKFIGIRGILLFTVPVFIMETILTYTMDVENIFTGIYLLKASIIWILCGVLYGLFQWSRLKKRASKDDQIEQDKKLSKKAYNAKYGKKKKVKS